MIASTPASPDGARCARLEPAGYGYGLEDRYLPVGAGNRAVNVCSECQTEYDGEANHTCSPRPENTVQSSADIGPSGLSADFSWQQSLSGEAAGAKTASEQPAQAALSALASAPWDPQAAADNVGGENFDQLPNEKLASPQPEDLPAGNMAFSPDQLLTVSVDEPPEIGVYLRDDLDVDETLDMRFHIERPEDPMIGATISNRYQIISAIARGGMGVVYKAEQVNVDRLVAIKMLHPHLVTDTEAIGRFKAEAQAISRVEHPHSVRIYDFGTSETGQPYIVMDYITGTSLRDVLRSSGVLSLPRAGAIFEQVVDALSTAHAAGVVHRDLKPENIMLGEKANKKDWVSVVDFGISALVTVPNPRFGETPKALDTRGSPPYMSPEQCTIGCAIDHRSDIYSLAVVLYESLSGRLPYNARTASAMMEAHLSAEPLPLKLANDNLSACDALTALLSRALEKRADKRQQTIDEFGEELREAIKRDGFRLNYLINRKDMLNAVPSDSANVEGADQSAEDTMVEPMKALFPSGTQPAFKFVNCPHCNEPVKPDVAFCLGCGRSLANTQEFSKVRVAQGVFALPTSRDASSTSLPAFTAKARALPEESVRASAKGWWIASFILAIAIFYFAGGVDVITRALTSMVHGSQQ